MTLIVATAGSSSANSYATLAEANIYFSKRLAGDFWALKSEEDREKSLIMATSNLDTLSFSGRKSSVANFGDALYQFLEWPRLPPSSDIYMLNLPHLMFSKDYNAWMDNQGLPIIPYLLKEAEFEEAHFLIKNVSFIDKRDQLRSQGVTSISGSVNENFASKTRICERAMLSLLRLKCLSSSSRLDRG